MSPILTLPKSPFIRGLALATLAACIAIPTAAHAQTQVYSENFDTDHSIDNTWVTNTVGGYNPVNIYFDYSSVGIPSAPHSTGGTTRGLKLQANLETNLTGLGIFPSGSSMSPSGFSITENFEMRWDWWLNFNGPLNGGGSGSTQIGGAGFGTAATSANVPTVIDSIFVGCSGDGAGTTADYRVYTPSFSASLQDASGVYAAGTTGSRNNTHAYYQTAFPPQSATNNCPNQLLLYPQQTGLTQGGSAGMKWHDISLKKVANIITYTIDGLLIATIDASTNGTLGGANIVFGQFDINAGASVDSNAVNLAFSLVDNVRITNFGTVVTATAVTPVASETGPTPGKFTITRTSSGTPLTVNFAITGSASPGADYTALPSSVTFGATATSIDLTVNPVDDSIAEITETVILTISDSPNYQHGGSATVSILDNESPQLTITNISAQVYERTNDYATFQVTRLGNLDAASFDINLGTASGSAVSNVNFYADASGTFDQGVQSKTIKVYPIDDALVTGDLAITLNVAPSTGGAYSIGSPGSASVTLVDSTLPPETVLFSDNFTVDSSANWSVAAPAGDGNPDYSATFAFDYSAQGIPPAPHSSGDTLGLYLTANKDATGSAAAVNLYPIGQNFSGNFALRFDLFISIIVPNSVGTEYVLFGINHSGTKTNWFRNSPGGIPNNPTFDGIFYSIEADGAGLGDYVNYSSPTTNGNNPTALSPGRVATTLSEVFKSPPNSVSGVPGNNTSLGSPTPIWADVEINQIGNVINFKINQTLIFAYTNTTPYSAGDIMLGYDDAFDSIGLVSSYAVFDNVRVISLAAPVITTSDFAGGSAKIDFTANNGDVPAQFVLQSAPAVTGPFADVSSTITSPSAGHFHATRPAGGGNQFYRIRRAF